MTKEIVIKFDYAKNGFMVSVVSGNVPANSEQRPSVYQHELVYEESAMGQAIGDMALSIIQMGHIIQECSKKEKNMEKENLYFKMEKLMI